MNWIELSVGTDAEGAEAAAVLLNEFVNGGAVIEETITPNVGEPFDPARAFIVRAFFSSDAGEALKHAETGLWHLAQLRAMGAPRVREIAEEDWAEAWKRHYPILHLGKHLIIKPAWLAYTPGVDQVVIELDPGMAFGTGLHPTTQMCLSALEARVTQDTRALDVGAGSGILSIAAAKLGASQILALDLDPLAVETTTRNVAINRVEKSVRVQRGTIDSRQGRRIFAESERDFFDLVCINILAEVICDLAPAIASALRPNGIVIASGILDYKADDVIDAFRAVGIGLAEKKQQEDWIAIIGMRHGE